MVGTGKNPITLVRKARYENSTDGPGDSRGSESLSELESPFRVMVLLDATTGLRRSELLP